VAGCLAGASRQTGYDGAVARGLTAVLLATGMLGGGCATTVGNYLANRARDFGECFRLEVGGGLGIGGGVRAAGVMAIGLGGGVHGAPGAGWRWGRPVVRGFDDIPWEYLDFMSWSRADDAEWELYLGFAHVTMQWAEGCKPRGSSKAYALLPGVWTYDTRARDPAWIWDAIPEREYHAGRQGWLRVHAFDVEASLLAGIVGVTAGFSPGELLDFLLGWFGADLAGDDRVIAPPAAPAAHG
jgi:hypothetical protein